MARLTVLLAVVIVLIYRPDLGSIIKMVSNVTSITTATILTIMSAICSDPEITLPSTSLFLTW